MKKLSLAELKAQSQNKIVSQLEAINGGETSACHVKYIIIPPACVPCESHE